MESPLFISAGFKSFLALSVVLGLAGLMLYVWRRISEKANGYCGQKHLRAIGRCYLGPKKYVCMVKIPDAILVLGVSEGGINLLSKIRGQDVIQSICGAEKSNLAPLPHKKLSASKE